MTIVTIVARRALLIRSDGIPSRQSWRFAALVTMLVALPTLAANAGDFPIVNIGARLHARALGETYLTKRGDAICVQTAEKSWLLWYVAHPGVGKGPTASCLVPTGATDIAPALQFGPTGYYAGLLRPATFSGATSIYMYSGGYPGVASAHCAPLFSTYYVVKQPSGHTEAFYIFVRLKKPRRVSYSCSEGVLGGVRIKPVTIKYDDVGPLESIDAGDGTSILEAFALNATHPVLLRVRTIPSTLWASGGDVFLIPQSVVGSKLTAAGWDPLPRYEALLSVIRSTRSKPIDCTLRTLIRSCPN